MPDHTHPPLSPLQNGTAVPSVETAPDGPVPEATVPSLTNLGSDDAAVCTDGVCAL